MASMALDDMINTQTLGIEGILDLLETRQMAMKPLDPNALAHEYLRYRNWPQALKAFESLHHQDPENLDIRMNFAKVAIKCQDHERARVLIGEVIKGYLKESRYEAAIVLTKRMISWSPDYAPFHQALISVFEEIGARLKGHSKRRYFEEQALDTLRRVVRDRRIKANSRLRLRWMLAISKRDPRDLHNAKAIVGLLEEAGKSQRVVRFLCMLADHLLSRGHLDAAERILEIGHRVDSHNPQLRYLYYLGEAHKGRASKALTGLTALHETHPNDLTIIRALALLEWRYHRYNRAVNWLLCLFEKDQRFENRLLSAGQKLLGDGNIENAFKLYKALAQFHCQKGSLGIAIRLMSDIHKAAPRHQQTLETLGGFYLLAGRHVDAHHFLDQAFSYYLQENEPEMGQVLVRSFLSETPQNPHLLMWYRKFKRATHRLLEDAMI